MTGVKKLTILLLVLTFMVVILLTGCGGEKTVADVSFMYAHDTPGVGVATYQWLQEYTRTTGKKVQDLSAPSSGYGQKLVVLIGARQAPDLFVLPPEELPNFIQKGAVVALDSYMQHEKLTYPDRRQYPYLYGADGKLYGLQADDRTTYVIFIKAVHPAAGWDLLKFLLTKVGKI